MLPGVRIEDCGRKIGLNGVDNGRIWFDQVRVPRDALLNRYADVTEDGTYFSEIENPDRRFFTMLGTLVQGRVCVGGAAINASKVALAIAVHYGAAAPAVRPAGHATQETLLLDYGQHQRRLLPLLARTYALHFAQERVAADLHRVFSDPDNASERLRRGAGVTGGGDEGARHLARDAGPSRSAARPAAAPATCRSTGSTRCAPTPTSSPRSRATTPILHAAGRQGPADRPARLLRRARPDRHRALRRRASPWRPWWRRPRCASSSSGSRDAVPGRDGDGDPDAGLLDPDYHLSMLRWREDHMTSSVARRIKAGVDRGGDPVEVFSRAQDHVIAAAWAHAERLVLEAFLTKVQNMPEGSQPAGAQHGLRPVRALGHRGGPGVVHRARAALDRRAPRR